MTKASSKNMFVQFSQGILHCICFVSAINCYVKSIYFVSLLPRGFVCGTRFRMYGFHIYIYIYIYIYMETIYICIYICVCVCCFVVVVVVVVANEGL